TTSSSLSRTRQYPKDGAARGNHHRIAAGSGASGVGANVRGPCSRRCLLGRSARPAVGGRAGGGRGAIGGGDTGQSRHREEGVLARLRGGSWVPKPNMR